MACTVFTNTCPSPGDPGNVLLAKILQVLNDGGGSGVAGVSAIKVNGGANQTGVVNLTIPQNTDQLPEGSTNFYFTNARAIASTLTGFVAAPGTVTAADSILTALQKVAAVTNNPLLNFQDQNADADGVVYINSGATEVFRTVGTSSYLKFTTNATTMRLHTSALDDSFTFLASPAKADGAFLEVYGTSHATGLGGATVSIHDGGQYRVRSAPIASTVSVLRTVVDGTTGFMGVGTLVTPVTELMVQSVSAADPRGIMTAQYSADTIAARFHFRKSRGATAGTDAIVVSGDMLGRIRFSGYSGASYLQMASIDVGTSGTIGATRIPTYMTFSTATDVTPSVLTEAMRISNQQFVGIGHTAPTEKLDIRGTGGSGGILIQGRTSTVIANALTIQCNEGTGVSTYSAYGPDTATRGAHNWYIARSNNGSGFTPFRIANTGFVSIGASSSATPSTDLDVNNSTTTTKIYVYHTTDGAAAPTNYSRIAISHNAAATGRQTANFAAETGGTGAADIDIRLRPTGLGGLYLGPVADAASTGGNARGSYAIDLQWQRAVAASVASGLNSVIGGGSGNTASGSYSTVAGGFQAVASNYGQRAYASGRFTANGDAQTSVLIARRQTTDGTAAVELFLDGAAATQRALIPTDTAWCFSVLLVARRTDADNECAMYKFEGGIDNNAGTTALVGTVTKTVLAEDTAAWDADVVANDTNDAIKIQVTGEAAKTINWVARMTLVEVTG